MSQNEHHGATRGDDTAVLLFLIVILTHTQNNPKLAVPLL